MAAEKAQTLTALRTQILAESMSKEGRFVSLTYPHSTKLEIALDSLVFLLLALQDQVTTTLQRVKTQNSSMNDLS